MRESLEEKKKTLVGGVGLELTIGHVLGCVQW